MIVGYFVEVTHRPTGERWAATPVLDTYDEAERMACELHRWDNGSDTADSRRVVYLFTPRPVTDNAGSLAPESAGHVHMTGPAA